MRNLKLTVLLIVLTTVLTGISVCTDQHSWTSIITAILGLVSALAAAYLAILTSKAMK